MDRTGQKRYKPVISIVPQVKEQDIPWFQKTLADVSMCDLTCATLDVSDHWYWESDHLILAWLGTKVSIF